MEGSARSRSDLEPGRAARALGRGLAAGLALGGGALLLAPAARGFTLLNPPLSVDAAHARVFNNFADAETNDNLIPEAELPGYVGATLAIWKATVEWGSRLHGTGTGDPTQPGDLGSGGSNFDPTFQGAALGPGAIGDNVHSAVPSLGGGVLAITEVGGGGWRTRYSDAFTWDDDPAGPAPGAVDLQTVTTHEYGHALGLGHSSVAGSVMSAVVSGGGIQRDLGPDDQAGLQAIYGVAAPGKPRIEAVLVDAAGQVTLLGQGFAPLLNEAWFTQAAAGGTGAPVAVTGLVSTDGGTRIELALPAAAGAGDVLVKAPGVGFATLSNAWPLDVPGGGSCGALAYGVGLGGANQAELDAASSPKVGTTFLMALSSFPVDGPAFTLIAASSAALPLLGGTVLVDPGALILALATSVTGGSGVQAVPIPPSATLAGARVFAQSGQPGPTGFTLSNGLEIVVCP
jgi:hypothetical protein